MSSSHKLDVKISQQSTAGNNRLAVVMGVGGLCSEEVEVGKQLCLLLPPDLRWRMVAFFAM